MTTRHDTASRTAAPPTRWAGHRVTAADHPAVWELFTEPEFFFRTAQPETLAQAGITALLGDETHLITADGRPAGLWAAEPMGAEHACHHLLDLRLSARLSDEQWQSAYREVVAALRLRTEVVRLTVRAGDFDERWTRVLRGLGLNDEGLLDGVVLRDGRRRGYHYFSQLWKDRP
ncbi:hypothetical protein RVR_2101 [Actinacidiphila reveromycinica]|uniref:GNAT family N-acetyltransferase n=1 Tax=Actinacidiphila reveromycinica TaxID=659352 RepID=A0A7U3UQ37_9ACTN|nr:hypothetical protein [Streptomyces sp. SN-593]BBA96686.1 hypothetical protein RVR_2101 [Streptomyces sp. SN-593]